MRELEPIQRFSLWYRIAVARCPGPWLDPSAMTLATSSKNGEVTARIVLLKSFGPDGFTFYTNYASRKGKQISENPRAALVFHWPYMQRQIRIEGSVEKIDRKDSEKYFHSRPRSSQLAAAVSEQSSRIPSRRALIDRFKELDQKLSGQEVPLPSTWGGYRLVPDVIEFWRHRENRLHDRLRYRIDAGEWKRERLAP